MIMALEKSGKLMKFFLLLCGHPVCKLIIHCCTVYNKRPESALLFFSL